MNEYFKFVEVDGITHLVKFLYDVRESGVWLYRASCPDANIHFMSSLNDLWADVLEEIEQFEHLRPLYVMEQQYLSISFLSSFKWTHEKHKSGSIWKLFFNAFPTRYSIFKNREGFVLNGDEYPVLPTLDEAKSEALRRYSNQHTYDNYVRTPV